MQTREEKSITVTNSGIIEFLSVVYLLDDGGAVVGSKNFRDTFAPGDDVTNADAKVQAAAAAFWNAQVIADYKASQE